MPNRRIAEFNKTSPTLKRGVGVASCWYGCGNTSLPNPSTIRLGMTADGRLLLHQGATDIGQGSNTVIPQICADALGLPLDQFELIGPDTALSPDCGKTSASRQTFVTGKAAMLAGQDLRQQILRMSNMGPDAVITLRAAKLTIADQATTQEIDLGDLPLAKTVTSCRRKKPTIHRPLRLIKTVRASPTPFTVLARNWPRSKSTQSSARSR